MIGSFDPGDARVWPSDGAGPAHVHVPGTPTDVFPLDVESLAHRVLDALPLFSEASKIAELVGESQNLWQGADTHPLVLLLLLIDKYGQEFVEWAPEVLSVTMKRDGIVASNRNMNKVYAARVLLSSPSPWRQWNVFHWVCRALNGETPNFVFLEAPEICHLVVGVDCMKIIDPPRLMSFDIDKFVAAVFKNDGIPYIPSPLDFAQRELEDTKIECTTCGAVHRDDNDTKCITCGESTLKRLPYEFEAMKNECRDLFEARRTMSLSRAVDGLPDTGAGSAVYRLLVEWDAANTMRAHLHQQLRMIGGR